MTAYVALLRGINVGGANKLPMKDLREIAEAAGAQNPNTYIQSGNLVFSLGKGTIAAFEKKLRGGVKKKFGFEPPLFVADLKSWRVILKKNPFADADDDHSKIHVMFLEEVPAAALKAVKERMTETEQIKAAKQAIYFYAPDGIARSKAAEQLARGFPKGTMRNWRSCLKIEALALELN